MYDYNGADWDENVECVYLFFFNGLSLYVCTYATLEIVIKKVCF